jgi:hypothetical protein
MFSQKVRTFLEDVSLVLWIVTLGSWMLWGWTR